jgi:glycerol uptake facilitator-like aquaporin
MGEFLASFIFTFTLFACCLNSSASVGPILGPLSAGFAATAAVFAFGGHFNPAVTVGALVARKIEPVAGAIFIAMQLAASFVAAAICIALFPGSSNTETLLLQPSSSASTTTAFFMEFILTFILVFVIFHSAMGLHVKPKIMAGETADEAAPETIKEFRDRSRALEHKKQHAGLVIGLTIGFLAMIGGSVSGGAFNPLRVTAPAFYAVTFTDLWVYWVADLAGGVAAALLHVHVFED